MKVKAPAIDTSGNWIPDPVATGHKGTNAMNSTILYEKLEADRTAAAALRKAKYEAANARYDLTAAVLQAVVAGDLPADVLTVNVGRLRRTLFSPR